MCAGMNWLLLYLFVTTVKIAVNQASLDSMKTAPDTCSIEQFVSISSLNNPASITPHPLLNSAYILGTSQGVARANSETTNFLDLQLPNTEVGGVESDSDGKVLFTDSQRYCIKSYDVTSDTEEEWAGRCGTYGDSTVSSTVNDARFAQLYDLAGNSEKTLFYVNQQRSKIRVISTVDDTVELKMSTQEIYALAVAANGDLYFAAKKSVYVVAEDSTTSHLVAGRPNQSGSNDGELTEATFTDIYGIVHLAEYNWVIVSDRQNKLLRIIDIDNNEVTSICGGSQSEGSLDDCQLNRPQGLILHGGGLVLVDEDEIKRITCPGDDTITVGQTTTVESEITTTTTTTESETTTTTGSETTTTTDSETTTTTESETTTTTESETTTTTESETTTTTESETTTTTESETTTTIEQATTTTAAPGPTMKMTAVGSRTAAGMWLEWSGTDNSTCSGTLARHFSTEQFKDCMMACVVSTNCYCLSFGNGVCDIYHL